MHVMGETNSDFGPGGWGSASSDPSLVYDGRIRFAILPVTFLGAFFYRE